MEIWKFGKVAIRAPPTCASLFWYYYNYYIEINNLVCDFKHEFDFQFHKQYKKKISIQKLCNSKNFGKYYQSRTMHIQNNNNCNLNYLMYNIMTFFRMRIGVKKMFISNTRQKSMKNKIIIRP